MAAGHARGAAALGRLGPILPATTKYGIALWEREWRDEVRPRHLAETAAAARPGEVDRLLIARGIDVLNFIALDPALDFDDLEAYVRLREISARVAVGALEPVAI